MRSPSPTYFEPSDCLSAAHSGAAFNALRGSTSWRGTTSRAPSSIILVYRSLGHSPALDSPLPVVLPYSCCRGWGFFFPSLGGTPRTWPPSGLLPEARRSPLGSKNHRYNIQCPMYQTNGLLLSGCRRCTRACPVLRQSGWPRADHPDHTHCVKARGDVVWRVRVNQPTGLGHVLTDLNRAPWGSPVGTRACEVKPLSKGDIGTVGVQSRGASAPTVCPLARPVERPVDRGPVRSTGPTRGGYLCVRGVHVHDNCGRHDDDDVSGKQPPGASFCARGWAAA